MSARNQRPGRPARPARLRRWLRRVTAATTAAGVLVLGAPVVSVVVDRADTGDRLDAGSPVQTGDVPLRLVSARSRSHPRSHPWRGHPDRRILHYTVHRGDSALGLAVRFHAWTDELLRLNHLTLHSRLHVGQHVLVPVVVSAARHARRGRAHGDRHAHHPSRHRRHSTHHARHHKARHKVHHRAHHKAHHRAHHTVTHHHSRWRGIHATRAQVRRIVARTARRHGVAPTLALAIAWHESGWQQHRVSSSGALGVMQVMPATGRWLSSTAGRRLHLRRLRDNVTAGVLLIQMLRAQVGPRGTMAGYYQGLGSVQRYGRYPSTRRYVATVSALRKRLRHGWNPA